MVSMHRRGERTAKTKILASILSVMLLYTQLPTIALAAPAKTLPDLIPGGHTVGVRLHVEGVMVIGLTPVVTANGEVCPAKEAGLMPGDMITEIDNTPVTSAKALQDAVNHAGDREIPIQIERDGDKKTLKMRPVKSSDDGMFKIGSFIRDSVAGIGTLTFYDPNTKLFGALGHGIGNASDHLFTFETGSICRAHVKEVVRGLVGKPGELKGEFAPEEKAGSLRANTNFGIFGLLEDKSLAGGLKTMPVAGAREVKTGSATILANVAGDTVHEYDIEIVKIYGVDSPNHRHFMLRVTDPELLELTGGIVQGMSGSPIIQNGKLVGAVTHVLVGDPKRGYGLFLETMFEAGEEFLDDGDAPLLKKVS